MNMTALQFSAKVGIDNSLIGKYESGSRIPSVGDLIRLSSGTGLPIKIWIDDDFELIPPDVLENL